MVRMDDDLLAKLDRDRGATDRSDHIRRLVADYNGRPRPAKAKAAGPHATRKGMSTPTPSDCSHPMSRRIGDGCGACGKTGLAKR
jgi:hypothetical protein